MTGGSGLQAERTSLSWQRTTLGVLINGALLTLRESDEQSRVVPSLVLAAAALLLAAVVAVVGRRRHRVLRRRTLPTGLAPSREVALVGWAVVALCIGGAVVLVAA